MSFDYLILKIVWNLVLVISNFNLESIGEYDRRKRPPEEIG